MALSFDYPDGTPGVRINEFSEGLVFYPSCSDGQQYVAALVYAGSVAHRKYHMFFDDPAGEKSERGQLRARDEYLPPPADTAPYVASVEKARIRNKRKLAYAGRGVIALKRPPVMPIGSAPNTSNQGPLLASISSECTGFAVCGLKGKQHEPGTKLVLSKKGAVLTSVLGPKQRGSTGAHLHAWAWDPKQAGAGEPPRGPVQIQLNKHMQLVFRGRGDIRVHFECDGLKHHFQCGYRERVDLQGPPVPRRTLVQLQTAGGRGRGRGPHGASLSPSSLVGSGKLSTRPLSRKVARDRRGGVVPPAGRVAGGALAALTKELDEAMEGVRNLRVAPHNEPGWKEQARLRTLQEVPRWEGQRTQAGIEAGLEGPDPFEVALAMAGGGARTRGSGGALRDDPVFTMRDRDGALDAAIERARKDVAKEAAEATLRLTQALHGAGASRARGSTGVGSGRGASRAGSAGFGGLAETKASEALGLGDTFGGSAGGARLLGGSAMGPGGGKRGIPTAQVAREAMDRALADPSDGYGTARGASWVGGKWVGEIEMKARLTQVHPALPKPVSMRQASGRYNARSASEGGAAARAASTLLAVPEAPDEPRLQRWLQSGQLAGRVVLVACVRGDEPASRAAIRVMEKVQSTMARLHGGDPDLAASLMQVTASKAVGGRADEETAGGDGTGGRSPFVLRRVELARSPGIARKYRVTAAPLFLAFRDGKLIYRGAMGGATVVRLPASNRVPNALLVEPQAAHRLGAESSLKQCGGQVTTVGGSCDPRTGRATDVALSARRAMELHRKLHDGAARRVRASRSLPGGTNATAQTSDDFALVLIGAGAGAKEAADVSRAVGKPRQRTAAVSPSDGLGEALRLRGRSLVVALLPTGSVLPGRAPAEMAIPGRAKVPSAGASNARATDAAERKAEAEAAAAEGKPWCCPRTGLVMHPKPEHLLGGSAACAVVRPLKPAGVQALLALWQGLVQEGGGVSSRARAAEEGGGGTGKGTGGTFLPGQKEGRDGDGDGVHLGLTHNDLIERLHGMQGARPLARAEWEGGRPGASLALSASETTVRGTTLGYGAVG